MNIKLKGTGVALITPFRNDDSVDFEALGRITEHVIQGGVDYIVAMGTTGESATLSAEERSAVVGYIVEKTAKRVPIVLGLGGNYTSQLVSTLKSTNFDGIDAILSVAPYYNKPNQKGLYIHYKTLASASLLPIILYNVPGRTGVNIAPETVLSLAGDFENIVGVKEASGNVMQIMKIIKDKPKNFLVISGDDGLTMPLIAAGAEGVISVTANAFPKETSEMVRMALKGNFNAASELHYKLLNFTESLFEDGSPGGVKAALEILKICSKFVRLPLASIDRATYTKIENLAKDIKNYA
jgi:4-hydroxy-tetrahydrodipicolinate synthase